MKVVYEVRDNAGGYNEYPDETLEQFSKRMVPLVETRRVLSLLY